MESRRYRWLRLGSLSFILLLSLLISGCTTKTSNLAIQEQALTAPVSEGKSRVFGHILWMEQGDRKKIGKGLFDFYVMPSLLQLEDRSRTLCELDEDGNFIWELRPGTYVINRLEYRDTWSGNYFFVPQVAFRVQDPQKHYYIGELEVTFSAKRDLIGGLSGTAHFKVNDLRAADYPLYTEMTGVPAQQVEPSLMVRAQGLPTTFDTTAEFNLGLQILKAVLSGM